MQTAKFANHLAFHAVGVSKFSISLLGAIERINIKTGMSDLRSLLHWQAVELLVTYFTV